MINSIIPSVRLGKSTDRRGDVDAVIYDGEMLALLEIKSSPLVVYPLEVGLENEMTEIQNGNSFQVSVHREATINSARDDLALYLPHRNRRLSLGKRTQSNWPYKALSKLLQSQSEVAGIISAWKELRDVYIDAPNKTGRNADSRKWITCGCGSNVDDSKNRPGMERTDDIKKGTYQALKFGTYYKDKCARDIIVAVLASNFMPLRGYDRYLAEMQDVLWTKEEYAVSVQPEGVRAFKANGIYNLYDALLCLTDSIYHEQHLREISSFESFVEKFCQ